jgi:prevent-host-death family protein
VKTVDIDQLNLETCVHEAQEGGVLVTRNGVPAAVVLGVEGMDQEQVELGLSDRFWKLIAQRRQEHTFSRVEVEKRMSGRTSG